MLDGYHKTRQGPQFSSQGKRHGASVNNTANQGATLKAGNRPRNLRESTDQSKNREDNSARKASGVRTGNYSNMILTPNSKYGPKGRGQLSNSLINSESRPGLNPSPDKLAPNPKIDQSKPIQNHFNATQDNAYSD